MGSLPKFGGGGGGDLWWLKGGSRCGDIKGGGELALSYLPDGGGCGCMGMGGGEERRPPRGGGRWPTS